MFPYYIRDSGVAISATGDVTMSRLYSALPLGNTKEASVQDIWKLGQAQVEQEQEEFTEDRLREIFWSFAADDGKVSIPLTSLLDRQIFEGAEVR